MAPRVRRAFLGLGTNQGERSRVLSEAVRRLNESAGLRVRRVSVLYETEPVGPPGQEWYLNAVAEVELALPVEELLTLAKGIERDMGRVPGQRWGPRLIDIDILLVDDVKVATPRLTVPHPELEKRAFVLVPLATLVPHMLLPSQRTVVETLAVLEDPHRVIPYVRD